MRVCVCGCVCVCVCVCVCGCVWVCVRCVYFQYSMRDSMCESTMRDGRRESCSQLRKATGIKSTVKIWE